MTVAPAGSLADLITARFAKRRLAAFVRDRVDPSNALQGEVVI